MAAATPSSRVPLAPPPPYPLSTQHISTHPHPFDMLYSQNNRQQQQTTLNYGHLAARSSPSPSREKSLRLSPASANQIVDSHSSKSSTTVMGSSRSNNGSITSSVKATAQQMAMAVAAENAAAYYTAAAAAAAAASMLNPATAVNPFGNPLDWLGACTTSKRATSTISSPSPTVNNSHVGPIIGNSNTNSRTAVISSRLSNAGTCLSKSPVRHPTVGDFMSMLQSQAINNANDRSNSKNMADVSQMNGLETAAAALHQRSPMLNSSNVISSSSGQSAAPSVSSSPHKSCLVSGTAGSSTGSVPTSTSASAAHAAVAAAAASTLFGTVSPFSAPPMINPYAHLPGVVANAVAHAGAHSLPSPTIYPPTPPPSAPWIHPWYAGDTF